MLSLDHGDFVNPYNFVPLPAEVNRLKPWGHVGEPTTEDGEPLYCGKLEVEWELQTPLKLPSGDTKAEWWDEGSRTVRVPGSSIKGAVRSLHETMFNGCLRIFDGDHVPGYRLPAQSWTEAEDEFWRLSLVLEARDGLPTRMLLGEDSTFVEARALLRLPGYSQRELPTTGDVVELNLNDAEEKSFGNDSKGNPIRRFELAQAFGRRVFSRRQVEEKLRGESPSAEDFIDRCIFLITDVGARFKKGTFWAAARLSDEEWRFDPDSDGDRRALDNFRHACAGSDDRRKLSNPSSPSAVRAGVDNSQWQGKAKPKVMERRGMKLGYRVQQSGFLFPGDVVWAKVREGRLEELRLAQIWRRASAGPARERVPQAVWPCECDDGAGLCLSCATFGSIDASGEDAGRGENRGYRGHVAFSAAVAVGPLTRQVEEFAPLGNPKPGAGGFYLRGRPMGGLTRDPGDVAAHWDSAVHWGLGKPAAQLRGRKFYWHADPVKQAKEWKKLGAKAAKPRYEKAPGQPLATEETLLVWPEGNGQRTRLLGTITFDRLPRYAVQALMAAVDPNLLKWVQGRIYEQGSALVGARLATHLGGGKPLGLGTVVPRITSATVTEVADRYGSAPRPATEPGELTQKDIVALRERVGGIGHWRSLFKLLAIGALGDDESLVSYPPGADWQQFGTKEFAESFSFFKENDGERLTKTERRWTPLPEADKPQRIRWKKQRKGQEQQKRQEQSRKGRNR